MFSERHRPQVRTTAAFLQKRGFASRIFAMSRRESSVRNESPWCQRITSCRTFAGFQVAAVFPLRLPAIAVSQKNPLKAAAAELAQQVVLFYGLDALGDAVHLQLSRKRQNGLRNRAVEHVV